MMTGGDEVEGGGVGREGGFTFACLAQKLFNIAVDPLSVKDLYSIGAIPVLARCKVHGPSRGL